MTAIFAAGVAVGIISGVLDLSIPGVAALASCTTGTLLVNGQSVVVALAAGLVAGAVVGLLNGSSRSAASTRSW